MDKDKHSVCRTAISDLEGTGDYQQETLLETTLLQEPTGEKSAVGPRSEDHTMATYKIDEHGLGWWESKEDRMSGGPKVKVLAKSSADDTLSEGQEELHLGFVAADNSLAIEHRESESAAGTCAILASSGKAVLDPLGRDVDGEKLHGFLDRTSMTEGGAGDDARASVDLAVKGFSPFTTKQYTVNGSHQPIAIGSGT